MNIDLGPDDWGVASMQDAVIGLYSVSVVRLPSLESTTCMNQCIAMQLFSHEFSHSAINAVFEPSSCPCSSGRGGAVLSEHC